MPSTSSSFIRAAQYLTSLLAGQDEHTELTRAVVNFYESALWAGVCAPDREGSADALRFVSSTGDGSAEAMLEAVGEYVREVLDSGFLDTVPGPGGGAGAVVLLPIAGDRGAEVALVIVHREGVDVSGELLNEYLGIATLAGNMLRRLHLERENASRQQRLEERTAELELLKQSLEDRVARRTNELVDLNADLNAVLDNIADGLLVTDTDGRVVRFNAALLSMLGLQGGDHLVGRPCGELGEEVGALVDHCRADLGAAAHGEISLTANRFGKAVATGVRKGAPGGAGLELSGVVAVIRDTTFEREVDQMKTEFISTVSHELRTPLTSVLGFAKIIQKKLSRVVFPKVDTSEKKVARSVRQIGDNIGIIISEGERLTALINDVLDVAKMEAGKVDWKDEPISIPDLIDRACAATSALFAQQPSLRLVKSVDADIEQLTGDGHRLIQVIINLLSNAVKFTDEGTVECRARRVGPDIVVSVLDSGSGISEKEVGQVFEKFKQVGDVVSGKPKGTGLGLSICRQIVEHHGGRIWVESELGVGSNFSFTLPARAQAQPEAEASQDTEPAAPDEAAPSAARDDSRKTVLVVDDEPAIRAFLRELLTDAGYNVVEAVDGVEAIDKAREARPDLITLDVMMPRMGGYEAAAVLKTDPATETIPLLVLSATESQRRGRQMGVDDYIAKPADPEALLEKVEKLLSQRKSARKILVINEGESAIRTVIDALEAREHTVLMTKDGDEAIQKALDLRPAAIIVETNSAEREAIAERLQTMNGLSHVLFLLYERGAGVTDRVWLHGGAEENQHMIALDGEGARK